MRLWPATLMRGFVHKFLYQPGNMEGGLSSYRVSLTGAQKRAGDSQRRARRRP
jgi:hypothetical protein